jgi:hypothetical protein
VGELRIQDEALEVLYQDAGMAEVYHPDLTLAVNRKVLPGHIGVIHANFCVGEIDCSLFISVLENLLKALT